MKSTMMLVWLLVAAALWSGPTARADGQGAGPGDEISSIPFDTIPVDMNFVASGIGLQGNVDVDGDLSLAGDLRFADGTSQSTAAGPVFATTVVVSPVPFDPLASGQALRDAIAGILDAGPAKPYLVKLEPGIYDVASATDGNSLEMKPWVSIEGSDETVSEIRSGGSASFFEGTVVTADFSELRRVTVRNTGGDLVAIAVFAASEVSALDHVTAIASGGTDKNYGVRIAGLADRVRLFDVVAVASGGTLAFGISMKDVLSATLERVSAYASGPGEKIAFYVLNELGVPGMTVTFDNVVGEAEGGTSSSALRVQGSGVVMSLHRSTLFAHGAALNVGVDIQAEVVSSLEIVETTITATGPQSSGIRKSTRPELRLDHSRVTGETHSLFNEAGPEFKVGATRLGGGPASGPFTCVGVYNEDYEALAADCIALAR